jgi:hypothetical protein
MSLNALSGILNLLIGSSREVATKGSSKASTTRGLAEAKLKAITGRLQKDIRSSIDANLPVFYLVNAEIVVDEMFNRLHPSNGSSLTKFLVSIRDGQDVYSFEDVEGKVQQTKNAFGKVVSESRSDGFIDLYTKKYNTLLSRRDTIISNCNLALKRNISKRTTVRKISEQLALLNAKMAEKIKLAQLINDPDRASAEATKHIRAVGALLRRTFKSAGISVITDADFFLVDYDRSKHTLVSGANYTETVKVVHNTLTQVLERYAKALGLEVFDGASGFKAGNFAAAGHSALVSGSNVIGINTPQSIIASMILANNELDAPDIIKGFVVETGHIDYALQVTEGYADPSNIFFSLGLSVLQSQPFQYNSDILKNEEVKYFSDAFKSRFNKNISELRKQLTSSLNNPKVFTYIFKTFRLSPTLKESLEGHFLHALGAKKFNAPNKSANYVTNNKSGRISISGSTKKQQKAKSNHNKIKTPKQVKPLELSQGVSLVNLQTLLNANLVDRVKQNMGDGSRRDILNLRTGRFAESAKVERLSESRAGMITVFYSYMKNPYQTFEPGFKQGSPATRNPKLLIAKSIREIAGQMVANRLRSVSV